MGKVLSSARAPDSRHTFGDGAAKYLNPKPPIWERKVTLALRFRVVIYDEQLVSKQSGKDAMIIHYTYGNDYNLEVCAPSMI